MGKVEMHQDCTLHEALLSALGVHTLRVCPLILIDRLRVRWRSAIAQFCIDARALPGMRGGSQVPGSPVAELHGWRARTLAFDGAANERPRARALANIPSA